jgi:DNA-binding NarL/FixJ family response regulator
VKRKWTVFIVDDQTLIAEGLKSLLSTSDDFEVIGKERETLQAIRRVPELNPDLILLDLNIERMEAITALRGLRACRMDAKILILTSQRDAEYVLEVFKSGANGYCLKEASASELIHAARTIMNGSSYIDPGVLDKVLSKSLEMRESTKPKTVVHTLTPREQEVLKLIGRGYKTTEIADLLSISKRTVEKHRSNMMKKLSLHRTSALVEFAMENSLMNKGGENPEEREDNRCRENASETISGTQD